MFKSICEMIGTIVFPAFSGIRILMMPYRLEDPDGSTPEFLAGWRGVLREIGAMSSVREGVACLTIDEAIVRAGETHRRPGLHVDGWADDSDSGIWGGGRYAGRDGVGMICGSNTGGTRAWRGEYATEPRRYGDGEHIRSELSDDGWLTMDAGSVYIMNPTALHEVVAEPADVARQFIRVSMPSDADWYTSCTPNPLGIMPTGRIVDDARRSFMGHRK